MHSPVNMCPLQENKGSCSSRIARIYDLTDTKAKEMIVKTDKKRASYYNYYSNKKWGSAESFACVSNNS